MKIRVYHSYYGCETGCCGHIVELEEKPAKFEFTHPYGEDKLIFARELAESVIKENYPECLDSIDWDSLTIDEISDD